MSNSHLSAEDFETMGKSHFQNHRALEAAEAFKSAEMAYRDRGDDLKAAELANNASVAYIKAGMADEGLQSVEGTPQIFAAAGDIKRQGMALGNLGAALEALGRNEDAISAYQESAEALSRAGEDQMQLSVVQSISMLQLKAGHQLQALATMEGGLQKIKKPNTKEKFLKRLFKVPLEIITRKR